MFVKNLTCSDRNLLISDTESATGGANCVPTVVRDSIPLLADGPLKVACKANSNSVALEQQDSDVKLAISIAQKPAGGACQAASGEACQAASGGAFSS